MKDSKKWFDRGNSLFKQTISYQKIKGISKEDELGLKKKKVKKKLRLVQHKLYL